MIIKVDLSALGKTKWHEYAVRFVFGGTITAATGVIGTIYGPVIAGLFLACPAIFPASATLIEKHEKQKKERLGLSGIARGRQAASVDGTGSALGSLGLLVFAVITWKFIERERTWLVLGIATFAWLSVSIFFWSLRKRAHNPLR
jgi:hypothetical protein